MLPAAGSRAACSMRPRWGGLARCAAWAAAASGALGFAAVASQAEEATSPYSLPIDKLKCAWRPASSPSDPAERSSSSSSRGRGRPGVVLVACGSFNPPTRMHMKMFEVATEALEKRGYSVWGSYLSPVHDSYGKPGLAASCHRLAMSEAAAAASPSVMVDSWEARQAGYTRTLQVLRHFRQEFSALLRESPGSASAAPQATPTPHAPPQPQPAKAGPDSSSPPPSEPAAPTSAEASSSEPRILLLCGADVLASMAVPGVWKNPDVLLEEFGVVCIDRKGADLARLLEGGGGGGSEGMAASRSSSASNPSGLLHRFRRHIHVIEVEGDLPEGDLSSTQVRERLRGGKGVEGLVPQGVEQYIREHAELYRK